MFNLCISNIAWSKDLDKTVYDLMKDNGFNYLEIAPTRIFDNPYFIKTDDLLSFKNEINSYGLNIVSMQSLIFNRPDLQLFESDESRKDLKEILFKAIDFASSLGIKNLVFGSPKNRIINNYEKDYPIAISFFKEIGQYALKKNTIVSLEANASVYGTNFLTTTKQAYDFVKEVNNDGIRLQLDTGTMLINNESVDSISSFVDMINHVHLSELNLEVLSKSNFDFYKQLLKTLKLNNYSKVISIEMKNTKLENIENTIKFVKEIIEGIEND